MFSSGRGRQRLKLLPPSRQARGPRAGLAARRADAAQREHPLTRDSRTRVRLEITRRIAIGAPDVPALRQILRKHTSLEGCGRRMFGPVLRGQQVARRKAMVRQEAAQRAL